MGDSKKHIFSKRLLAGALAAGMLITQTIPAIAVESKESNATKTTNGVKNHNKKSDVKKSYKDSDVVTLMIELDSAPLLSRTVKSRRAMSKEAVKQELLNEHNVVRNRIQTSIAPKQRSVMRSMYDYTTVFNGFTLETAFGNLEKIKQIQGVKRVFVSQEQALVEPTMKNSTGMVGANDVWQKTGYTGKGIKVAVVDTGLDLSHEAFQSDPSGYDYDQGKITTLFNSSVFAAKKANTAVTADDVYHNAKVPYQYDYADNDTDVSPENEKTAAEVDHGTHVAGTVAGYKADAEGVVKFSGIAPDAQLCIMKVFSDKGGGAYDHIVMAALEDAALLNVDTVNMSLGSPAGFSEERGGAYTDAFKRLYDAGVDLMVSAGNEYDSARANGTQLDLALSSNPDRGIVGAPSTFPYNTSVASINNVKSILPAIRKDNRDMLFTTTPLSLKNLIPAGQQEVDLPYVYIPGVGKPEDFEGKDVKGKIALIQRGDLAFTDKIINAADAGAIAVIVFDNVDGAKLNMAADGMSIPAGFITKADGEFLRDAADKTVRILKDDVELDNPQGNYMSDFSSLGVTPDLKLKPEITAPGGSIYSSIPVALGSYGSMDGTSMAAPHMSGMSAITREYIKDKYGNTLTAAKQRNLIDQLLMSTAKPVKQEDGTYYSPRKQGAGLANIYRAVTSQAYISVAADEMGNVRPKLNLGDDPSKTGVYTLTFDVNNLSDAQQTYQIKTTTLMDSIAADENGQTYILKEAQLLEEGKDVISDGNTVVVPAKSKQQVSLKVTLTEAGKAKLNAFENGDFVEGFVELIPETGNNQDISLTIPFMGFYGNWAQAPILEKTAWYDNDAYMTYPFEMTVDFGAKETLLGSNYLADTFEYNKDSFAISPNNDGYGDEIVNIDYGTLRGASKVEYTVIDKNGNVVYEKMLEKLSKSVYKAEYDLIFPTTAYEEFSIRHFNGKDASGKVLPDGQYTYKIKAYVDYKNTEGNLRDTYEVPIKIDTKAPAHYQKKVIKEDGKLYLTGTMKDANELMAVGILDENNQMINQEVFDDGENQYDFKFDITAYEDSTLTLFGVDYAYNEIDVPFKAEVEDIKVEVEKVSFDRTELMLQEKDTFQLNATVAPDNATNKKLNWSSKHNDIASVDQSGLVKANKEGTTTITATASNGVKASIKVQVKAKLIAVEKINITGVNDPITVGKKVQLHAEISPANASDKTIIWSSSDERVAVVDKNGMVTGVGKGTVTITATASNGVTSTFIIHVKAAADKPNVPGDDNKPNDEKPATDNKKPDTGDATSTGVLFMLLCVSGISILYFKKKHVNE